jgi:hypothetical protein
MEAEGFLVEKAYKLTCNNYPTVRIPRIPIDEKIASRYEVFRI